MAYPIFQLTGVKSSQLEQLGTKPKFWFMDQMMYPTNGDADKRLLTVDSFLRAAAIAPKGAAYWIDKLDALTEEDFELILKQIPNQVITQLAREFAMEMLIQNRQRLLTEFKSMAIKT